MDITTETVAPREVEFTFRPDTTEVEEARHKAARQLARRVRIPGFRPGKAPYVLVERTVGKEALTEEAAEILAPEAYEKAIEDGHYVPYDRPVLRVAQQEPLEMKVRVALAPVVELGDYCAMKVEPEPVPQVTPEQEEQALNQLREAHGTWVPVERAAQMGDQATMDILGVSDSETIYDDHGAQIVLTDALTPAGFAEAVVGMTPGEKREFDLTYPETTAQEQLAGKTVKFTVTLSELKERKLPELDDEFAKSVGDYESLDALKARLHETLQAQLDAEARDKLAMRVLDDVVAQSKVEYPNAAVEHEIDDLIAQRESRLRQQGFTLEAFLRATHKSLIQLRDELRPEAEESLRRTLVLREIAKKEKIQVSPEELTGEVNRVAQGFGEQADAARAALMQQAPLQNLLSDLYLRKALTQLVDIVTGKVQGACAEGEAPAVAEQAPAAEAPAAETPAAEEPPAEQPPQV